MKIQQQSSNLLPKYNRNLNHAELSNIVTDTSSANTNQQSNISLKRTNQFQIHTLEKRFLKLEQHYQQLLKSIILRNNSIKKQKEQIRYERQVHNRNLNSIDRLKTELQIKKKRQNEQMNTLIKSSCSISNRSPSIPKCNQIPRMTIIEPNKQSRIKKVRKDAFFKEKTYERYKFVPSLPLQ